MIAKSFIASVVGMASLSLSQASVLLEDTFTYPDGNLAGAPGSPWVAFSSPGTGSMQVISDRVFINDTNAEDDSATFSSTVNSDALYYSFTLNGDGTDPSTSTVGSQYFAAILNTNSSGGTVTSQNSRISLAKGSATGQFKLGVANASGNANIFYSSELLYGTDYSVVVKYDFATSQTTLWVDPVSESSTSVTATDSFAAPTLVLTSFILRQPNTTSMGDLFLDNLKVGTTFADVTPVPEPGAVTLVGLGIGTVLFGARRRRVI